MLGVECESDIKDAHADKYDSLLKKRKQFYPQNANLMKNHNNLIVKHLLWERVWVIFYHTDTACKIGV